MTCDEAREAFSDLFDGTLSGAPLAGLNQHLEGCSTCRAEWAAFWRAMQAVAGLGSAEPSPGFAARIRQQVEAPPWWKRAVQSFFFPLRVKVPIHALALCLLAFAGMMIYQRSPELHRGAEVRGASPGPIARPMPPPSAPPAPPVGRPPNSFRAGDETAQKGADAMPQADAIKSKRAERQLAQSTATTPPPEARVEEEKDRGPSRLRGEAKEAGKSVIPAKPGRVAESSSDTQAKEPAPRVALRSLQQSAPSPAESREVIGGPAQVKSLAPTREERRSSIPSGSADELFSAAVTEFVRQGYDRAIEGFRAFIAQHPRDARVADARFLLADAYFAQQRYAEAILEYETLVRQHPDSRRLPTALYRYGQARLALGDQGGCQLFRELMGRYPRAREATLAREALSAGCP